MADQDVLEVLVLSPDHVIFEGRAETVLLPGEQGVFEVLPHHKRILSRLLSGYVFIGAKSIQIKRGVAKVALNKVTLIVEEAA